MAPKPGSDSRLLLQRLRETLAEDNEGQERLDHITEIVSQGMEAEVCSVYLRRDRQTLELCATEGLKKESVHQTRMRVGEGLVGRIAKATRDIDKPPALFIHRDIKVVIFVGVVITDQTGTLLKIDRSK